MKKIRLTSAFRADYKSFIKSLRYRRLAETLAAVLNSLQHEVPLEQRFNDHALKGEWQGCRECHIAPDLLLIYRLDGDSLIALVRLNSHSELFR